MPVTAVRLPRTAKDIFTLSPVEWLLYNGVIAVARGTGLWRYPVAASGDIETMSLRDKIYWLYKAQFPISRARKFSNLEDHFARNAPQSPPSPFSFSPARELRVSAAGDLMTHPFLRNSAETLYECVADDLFGADVSLANLECVIHPSQEPTAFRMRSTVAPPLFYDVADFNVVKGVAGRRYSLLSTACNHSLDRGAAGVEFTIGTLKENAIGWHGTNERHSDCGSAAILEKEGFRIGVISHTFGLNGKQPPPEKPWIVNRTDLNGSVGRTDFSQIRQQIQFCRDESLDAIIAMLHWGMEHEYYPTPDQVDVAHHLAELGIDIVFGHHPHVIQPYECYRTRRDPNRFVPIYYSLGNLITPFTHPAFRLSGVAQVVLAKGAVGDGASRTYVKDASMIEVWMEIDEVRCRIRLVRRSSRSAVFIAE